MRNDVAMEIGAAQESVTVQAEAPLLQRETSAMGTEISDAMVKVLPYQLSGAQRNPFDLARLTPRASGDSNPVILASRDLHIPARFPDGVVIPQ